MSEYAVRVKRGSNEVEVRGPSEEWVREYLTELVEEHFTTASTTSPAPTGNGGEPSADGHGAGDSRTFRELLNAAPSTSAAEKCLLAAYVLHQQGQPSFGSEDVAQVFNDAMEKQINFHREVKNAVRRGWVARAGDANRYRIVNAGINRVRELAGATAEVA